MAVFFNAPRGGIWRISVDVLVLVLATFPRLLRNGLVLAHCEVLGGRLGRTGGRLGPALAREARGENGEDSWSQLGNVSLSVVWFNRRRGQSRCVQREATLEFCVTNLAWWSHSVTHHVQCIASGFSIRMFTLVIAKQSECMWGT